MSSESNNSDSENNAQLLKNIGELDKNPNKKHKSTKRKNPEISHEFNEIQEENEFNAGNFYTSKKQTPDQNYNYQIYWAQLRKNKIINKKKMS